jgi:hypothetical protein
MSVDPVQQNLLWHRFVRGAVTALCNQQVSQRLCNGIVADSCRGIHGTVGILKQAVTGNYQVGC